MRARFVNESLGKAPIYNKQEIINFMLANQEPETVDYLRHEYETLPKDEFEDLAGSIGFKPIGKYWTATDVYEPVEASNESLNESEDNGIDYSETAWKMDKFMPEDEYAQDEYYGILGNFSSKEEKITDMIDFLENYADQDTMEKYMPEDGTLEGFAEYLVNHES